MIILLAFFVHSYNVTIRVLIDIRQRPFVYKS